MKSTIAIVATAATLFAPTLAKPFPHQQPSQAEVAALIARAFNANAGGYKPTSSDCPSDTPSIRDASSLSQNETAWLELRRNATVQPMRELFGRLNITGFDVNSWMNTYQNNASALPNIGIAVSGGGYRAMLNGAGLIQAFDSRTPNSTNTGQLGGILQSTTYLSGLSGGSWLVGSLYSNNFTSVDEILATDDNPSSGDLWELENTIFQGPDSSFVQVLSTADYFKDLVDQVDSKEDAGFNVTITDYWGRALSYQLINATDGGPGYTFSSIAEQDFFTSASVPLPFIVTDVRSPGQSVISTNSTVIDINPWEMGSDDPSLYAFAPLRYVGTNFTAGSPRTDQCITGFDSASFVMGTSSSLFNAILATVNGTNTTSWLDSVVQTAIEAILTDIGSDEEDIADWVNPFYGFNNATNTNAQTERLTLVDGGEDGQNIPLHPLIQPERHVDVIFAVDSSADTNTTYPTDASSANWPDGISMVTTYERSLSAIGNGTVFPAVPDINTFMNLGLQNRPTFFGCDAKNLTGPAPLVVYMPNAPYVYNSNVSTFDLEYNDTQRNAIVLNAYNGATQGNGTLDADWPACVGCAILSRSFNRTNTPVPDICNSCFSRYCWDGTVNSTQPASYVPEYKLPKDVVKVTSGAAERFAGSVSAAVLVALFTGVFMV